MKVMYEKPCQRRHHRVTAPMNVTLPDGTVMQATNWSLGGLRLDGLGEKLPKVDEVLDISMELPFQGFDISFDANCRVARTVPNEGTIGLEFNGLSERATDLMRHFIDDLVRGNMTTVDDTICRIDVPVTPISTQPDPNPTDSTPVSRWPLKSIMMSTFYIMLSVMVFGYLLFLVYSNVVRLEISSAVVSAPLANIHVPVDGMLQPVRLAEDTIVEKGQTLARILDTKIESQIADKRIALDQAKRNLERAEERYKIEGNRLKLYQIVNRTDREISMAAVIAEREALQAIDQKVVRLSKLREKGLVIQPKLDEAVMQQAAIAGRLRKAELELERDSAMEAVSGRRYFNHKEFVADLDMLALEVEEANAEVAGISQQLEKLYAQKASMIIRAPFHGRIVATNQIGNVMVFRNQRLVTLEKLEIPTVTAFLDQDEVLEVGLSDNARVFVPALDRHVNAKVYKIDRSSAFLDPKTSHYAWTDSTEKSAAVSLRLDVELEQLTEIRAGLPVVVIFAKRNTNSLLNDMADWIGSLRTVNENASTI